jgi:hypothetical protein
MPVKETKEIKNATPTNATVEAERTTPVTTTTVVPTRRIRSTVPSRLVLRMINPFVSMILRSPLHRMLSNGVLLLTFTGRKTWKRYTIPVGYTREGDTLTLFTSKSWFKNLRGSSPVVVHLKGRGRTGGAEAIEDREAVLEAAEHLVAKYGLKKAGRRIGLAIEPLCYVQCFASGTSMRTIYDSKCRDVSHVRHSAERRRRALRTSALRRSRKLRTIPTPGRLCSVRCFGQGSSS